MFQQQVEAAQVAAAELGGLAGAGLSVGDGPHRVDDICRRRRGQAGRGLPAVLGSPLPAWALDETGNGPSTPRELRGSPGEDLTFAGIQVCPNAHPDRPRTNLHMHMHEVGRDWVREGPVPLAPLPLSGPCASPASTHSPSTCFLGCAGSG